MIPPVALGMRAGHCPLSTSGSQLRAPHPRTVLGTLVSRPSTAGPPPERRRRLLGRPPKYSPWATCARGKEGFQGRHKGASLGGGRDWRRQARERVPKRRLLLHGGHWEAPRAELETFLPRGSTSRGRVTPSPDDLWTLLSFKPGPFGRAGSFGAGCARRGPELEPWAVTAGEGRGWRGRDNP